MLLWTAGLLLSLGLAWLIGAVAVPVWQVHRVMAAYDSDIAASQLPGWTLAPADQLGGQAAAARKIDLYLRMPDFLASHKRSAIDWLRYCGQAGVGPSLRMLRSPNDQLRARAYSALFTLGYVVKPDEGPAMTPESYLALLAGGAYDRSAQVRSVVAFNLKYYEACRCHATTLTKDRQPPRPEVSRAMVSLLADPDEAVRLAAAAQDPGVGIPFATDDPAVIAALVRLLTDKSAKVRGAVPGRLRYCDISRLPFSQEVIDALVRASSDPSAEVRGVAAEMLGLCNSRPMAVLQALERLKTDPEEKVRDAAAEALTKLGG